MRSLLIFCLLLKKNYDKLKINTIIIFAPFSDYIWCKAFLHAYNNLMNNGDILVCLVPYSIYKDITDIVNKPNIIKTEYINVFDLLVKCINKGNVYWKTSSKSYLPDYQLYYDAVIVHLQKI